MPRGEAVPVVPPYRTDSSLGLRGSARRRRGASWRSLGAQAGIQPASRPGGMRARRKMLADCEG